MKIEVLFALITLFLQIIQIIILSLIPIVVLKFKSRMNLFTPEKLTDKADEIPTSFLDDLLKMTTNSLASLGNIIEGEKDKTKVDVEDEVVDDDEDEVVDEDKK